MNDNENAAGETQLSNDEILAMLKTKADNMGVAYGPRIGIDALREKINKALSDDTYGSDDDEGDEDDAASAGGKPLSKAEREAKMRHDLQADALRLVRIRVANLNPAKKDHDGEFFTVANRFIGNVKKFVPFGEKTDEGYHVPYVIYKMMKARKYLSIKTKIVKGQIQITQRWVPEFAIEVLDPLTPAELKKLAVQQAVAAGDAGDGEE